MSGSRTSLIRDLISSLRRGHPGVLPTDVCPHCGGSVGVTHTRKTGNWLVRYLACTVCRVRFGKWLVAEQKPEETREDGPEGDATP